jgi:hypothetical protein
MRQLKMNVKGFAIIAAFLAAFALIPYQAQAMDMSYGDWEIDGFLRNQTGFWTENWEYAPNNDPLATCRNALRLNLNGKISDNLRLKAEVLGIYETEISREHGATEAGLTPIAANEYNQFDFREMRLDWRVVPGHNLRFGKQIVNWGESISARVGDVVNPTDQRFDLGFTNLEDSRMPIWMVRGLHQISSIGTTFDWIFSPYMEADRYRASRTLAAPFGLLWSDGSIDPLLGVLAGVTPTGGQKFAPQPNYQLTVSGSHIPPSQMHTINPGLNPANPATYWLPGGPILYTPQNSLYENITAAQIAAGGGMAMTSAGLPAFVPGYYLADLNSALGAYGGGTIYPSSALKDSRYGFKTSSNMFGAQGGVYFFHRHRFTPVVAKRPINLGGGKTGYQFVVDYDRTVNTYGFYANKNFDFGVLRTDIAYVPGYPNNTTDYVNFPDGIVDQDQLFAQVGFNKDFMIRALNPDQTFGLILEYVLGYTMEDDMNNSQITFVVDTPIHKDEHTLFFSLGTNYNFGMYAPNLTVIYNVRNSGLLQPSIAYTPDWMNRKWNFKLQYNMLWGDKLETGLGILEEKDLVVLTTQFSFP